MSTPPTWLVTDSAWGNRAQARALARGLGLSTLEIILDTSVPWRWLAPRALPEGPKAFGNEFAAHWREAPPQRVIGCGRQGALATRWIRQQLGERVRAVQILDPRLPARHWDAVVVPAHDGLDGDRVIRCTGSLHAIDDAALGEARLRFAALGRLPRPITALLVGGPTRAVRLDSRWFAGLADIIEAWLERDGGSLLVSGSGRTPRWLRDALRTRFGDAPGAMWFSPDDGDNPYLGYLAQADRIVVSPDSANLLSEAAATSAPLYTHAPRPVRGRLGELHRTLIESGRLRPLRIDATPWRIEPLRELPRVVKELRGLLTDY